MRPAKGTPAHRTPNFAELVCSNSLEFNIPGSASKMLKDEVQAMGSLVLTKAFESSVPAGGSLAVDRLKFSESITRSLEEDPLIQIHREEYQGLPETTAKLATGPLTSPPFARH